MVYEARQENGFNHQLIIKNMRENFINLSPEEVLDALSKSDIERIEDESKEIDAKKLFSYD